MGATRLVTRTVEKVWGRRDLPAAFGGHYAGHEPLGEVWFEHPDGRDQELLVKYLFTSQRLSIQVHPDDAAARRAGQQRGKDEAWFVLRADPGAAIGLGLTRHVSREILGQAARDGSIEALVDWRAAAREEVLYSPAGTVHALGAGLVVIEIQQNADVTYRLYDYGRARELHIDEALEVASPAPVQAVVRPYNCPDGREILAEGRAFVLERWRDGRQGIIRTPPGIALWLVPVSGSGALDREPFVAGEVWLVEGDATLRFDKDSDLLIAYPGARPVEALIG